MKIPNIESHEGEKGFSYLDVLVAITILSVGILGLTGAVLYGLTRSYESEQKLFAKQIAQSTVESIFVARDIRRTTGVAGWLQVGNVGNNPDPTTNQPSGIFVNNWHPIREDAGPDGVIGTSDDSCLGTSPCPSPGNPSNASRVIPGYQRRIQIIDVADPERPNEAIRRRQITVTVRYQIGNLTREEVIRTMITDLTT